jgi:hypothetical protein
MEQGLLRAREMNTEEEKKEKLRLLLGKSRCSLDSESIEIKRDDRDRGVYINMALRKSGLPNNPDHLLNIRYVATLEWVVESHWINSRVALFKDYNEKAYRYLSRLVSQKRWADASSMIYTFAINVAEMIRHPEIDLIESYIDKTYIKPGIYDRYTYEKYGRYDRYVYKSDVDFECNILYERSGDELTIGAFFRAGIDAFGVDRDRARLYINVVRDLDTMDIKILEVAAALRGNISESIVKYLYPWELDRADRLARIHDHLVRIDLSRHPDYRYMVEKTMLAKNLLEIRETAEDPGRFRKELKKLINMVKILLRDADERIAMVAVEQG